MFNLSAFVLEGLQSVFFFSLALWALCRVLRFFSKCRAPSNGIKSISIIIPARNEERRLPKLLNSIRYQTVKPLEVIVVNDDSSDATAEVAERYGAKVLNVKPPQGWLGKSFACYAGAKAAQGEILLFLDADVILAPEFLERFGGHIGENTVLSIQPYHILEDFYEHFSLLFNLIAVLGIDARKKKNCAFKIKGLFGPCIFFPRRLYEETGGHLLARSSIIEDMDMGISLAERGVNLLSLPHNGLISFRMYPEGIRSLIFGWMKNFATGASRSSFFTILQVFGIVATSFNCLNGIFENLHSPLLLGYILLYVVFLVLVYVAATKLGSFKWWDTIIWPLHVTFFVVVFLLSLVLRFLHIPIPWRGRKVYPS